MANLDDLYGELIHLRYVDSTEARVPASSDILDQQTARTLQTLMSASIDKRGAMLLSAIPMLWLVDESGKIIIALEDVVQRDTGEVVFPRPSKMHVLPVDCGKRGHPALVSGGAGRIGGELSFDRKLDEWVLTNNPGVMDQALLGTRFISQMPLGDSGSLDLRCETSFIDWLI